MYYLRKLPLLFALIAAVLSGLIGFSRSMSNNRILLQMIITMVVFFAVGMYIRHTLLKIINQIKEKEKSEEQKKLQELSEEKNETEELEPLKISEYIKKELKRSEK